MIPLPFHYIPSPTVCPFRCADWWWNTGPHICLSKWFSTELHLQPIAVWRKNFWLGVVVHGLRTLEAKASWSWSLRPAWCSQWIPGQPGLRDKTLFQNKENKKKELTDSWVQQNQWLRIQNFSETAWVTPVSAVSAPRCLFLTALFVLQFPQLWSWIAISTS